MEVRNVQKTGGSSFTLTLPKDWVIKNRLEKDGKVEMFAQKTGQLCLRRKTSTTLVTAKLFIDHLSSREISRELVCLYVSGFDVIDIQGQLISADDRRLIRTTCQKLSGFELFESTSKNIVLKNVSSLNYPANEFVQRMFLIISSMLEDLEEVLQKKNNIKSKDIVERDTEVDGIHSTIARQLNKQMADLFPLEMQGLSLSELYYYENVAIRLERIADHIVRIASATLLISERNDFRLEKPQKDRLNKVAQSVKLCQKVVMKQNRRDAHQLLNEFESIAKNQFMNSRINNKSPVIVLIEDSSERIRSYLANIAEETLNFLCVNQYIFERNILASK